ncbi:MAG: hypothetical protein ACIARQ_14070 [Phycisphaerales bacterium JB061]
MTTELSISLASTDQVLAAALMAMALIVIAFGSLALMMIARARFKRNMGKRRKEPKHIPDAWTESGKRLDVPPGELPPATRAATSPTTTTMTMTGKTMTTTTATSSPTPRPQTHPRSPRRSRTTQRVPRVVPKGNPC